MYEFIAEHDSLFLSLLVTNAVSMVICFFLLYMINQVLYSFKPKKYIIIPLWFLCVILGYHLTSGLILYIRM